MNKNVNHQKLLLRIQAAKQRFDPQIQQLQEKQQHIIDRYSRAKSQRQITAIRSKIDKS